MTREEKVEKLIEKIKNEINIIRKDIRYIDSADKNLVLSALVLLVLEEYINKPDAFMSYSYKDSDSTNYIISDKHLDIMLDEKFDFVFELIMKFTDFNDDKNVHYKLDSRYNAVNIINDKFFEFNFISIIGEILYDKKGHWGL